MVLNCLGDDGYCTFAHAQYYPAGNWEMWYTSFNYNVDYTNLMLPMKSSEIYFSSGSIQSILICMQYMLYVLASFLLFAAGGILGVFTAIDWFTLHNLPYLPSSIENDIENLRNSVAATSVSCFQFS